MKTTIELPDALMKQVKLRAVREGRKLKDTVAELLRRGLTMPATEEKLVRPRIGKSKLTGLPVVYCGHPPADPDDFSPERIADILLQQEVEWANVAGR
jgi:hypothetical protein